MAVFKVSTLWMWPYPKQNR